MELFSGYKVGNATNILNILKKQGLIVAFLMVLIVISCFYHGFLARDNVLMVLLQVSIVGVIACGMTLVVIGGNFDLSVGAFVSLSMVLSLSLHDKIGALPAVLVTLFVGLIIGAINGYLVGFLKLNSFIITLGTSMVISAVTLIYSKEGYVSIADPSATWFTKIGNGSILGIPLLVVIFAIVAVVFTIVLNKTLLGRYIFAVGGNKDASVFTGIRADHVVLKTFVLSGLTASMGGIMQASRLLGTQGNQGTGMEFTVLTAVILGGTSLVGGSGSILKTIIGVLMIGFINNGLIIIGLPYYSQWIVTSLILIIAVWLDISFNRGKR